MTSAGISPLSEELPSQFDLTRYFIFTFLFLFTVLLFYIINADDKARREVRRAERERQMR